jgi:hypothetical protein
LDEFDPSPPNVVIIVAAFPRLRNAFSALLLFVLLLLLLLLFEASSEDPRGRELPSLLFSFVPFALDIIFALLFCPPPIVVKLSRIFPKKKSNAPPFPSSNAPFAPSSSSSALSDMCSRREMKEIKMCRISSKKLPLNTQTSLQYYTRSLFFLSSLKEEEKALKCCLFYTHTQRVRE